MSSLPGPFWVPSYFSSNKLVLVIFVFYHINWDPFTSKHFPEPSHQKVSTFIKFTHNTKLLSNSNKEYRWNKTHYLLVRQVKPAQLKKSILFPLCSWHSFLLCTHTGRCLPVLWKFSMLKLPEALTYIITRSLSS